MALLNKTLSEREKAALYYHYFAGCNDWPLLFRIADNAPFNDLLKDSKNLSDYASKWKRSEKVITFLRQLQTQEIIKEHQKREEIEKDLQTAAESERTEKEPERKKTKFVDYTNPDNQRHKLNELINDASDPGEALDALKVIISGQRDDRQAAREQKQVRAYLPITCESCPLYQKAKARKG